MSIYPYLIDSQNLSISAVYIYMYSISCIWMIMNIYDVYVSPNCRDSATTLQFKALRSWLRCRCGRSAGRPEAFETWGHEGCHGATGWEGLDVFAARGEAWAGTRGDGNRCWKDTGETSITNSGPLRVRKIKLEKIKFTRHVHVPIEICHLTETATRHVWKDVDIEYRHTDLKKARERERDKERKSLPTPSKHNQTKQTLCA